MYGLSTYHKHHDVQLSKLNAMNAVMYLLWPAQSLSTWQLAYIIGNAYIAATGDINNFCVSRCLFDLLHDLLIHSG